MKEIIQSLNILIQDINETILFINNNFTEHIDSLAGDFKELDRKTMSIIDSLYLIKDNLKKEVLNLDLEHTNYPSIIESIINQIDNRLQETNKIDFVHGLSHFKKEVLIISEELIEETKLDYSIRNLVFSLNDNLKSMNCINIEKTKELKNLVDSNEAHTLIFGSI